MVVVGIAAGTRGTTSGAEGLTGPGTQTVMPGTGFAGGVTTICVEPWIKEPAASAVPTTMPSVTANGNAMIAPAADARSVKTPGRWITTVCCACAAVKAKRPMMRVRMFFSWFVDSFLLRLKMESSLIPLKKYLLEK